MLPASPRHSSARATTIDLLGPRVTVDELAAAAGTIGYEILTSLGARHHRIYRELLGPGRHEYPSADRPLYAGFSRDRRAVVIFAGSGLSHCVRPPFYFRALVRQMVEIGYYSLPVVGLTAIFAGMVLALQSYTGFARFSAEGAIANVVVVAITRELGPVLAGLMVAGRIGASMAAEIGTMRVTEQLDALTTLSTNPDEIHGRAAPDRRRSPCCRSWS